MNGFYLVALQKKFKMVFLNNNLLVLLLPVLNLIFIKLAQNILDILKILNIFYCDTASTVRVPRRAGSSFLTIFQECDLRSAAENSDFAQVVLRNKTFGGD